MKKYLIIILLLVGLYPKGYGQGENNIWPFGNHCWLDFSTNPPTYWDTLSIGGELMGYPGSGPHQNLNRYENAIAVSNATGQLQFVVKMFAGGGIAGSMLVNEPNIYDRDELPIVGTNLLGNRAFFGMPLVIPHPGNSNQYYIFYVRDKGLFYTLFDMSLNVGKGNIVAGFHNIQLSNFGTVVGSRMTSIPGCRGVWLVIRSAIANEYLSFLVDGSGVATTPVVSECGLLPLLNYQNPDQAPLVASPNGKLLVTGAYKGGIFNFPGGLELYDFELCSGKVKNARLLDTDSNYFGACFSPDNSKLYVTINEPVFATSIDYVIGKVYQYDLSNPTWAGILASRTLIITNPEYNDPDAPGCPFTKCKLGGFKHGPDGKIYLLNQYPPVCPTSMELAFHVIQQPNNVGLACNPLTGNITNGTYNVTGNQRYVVELPHDIKFPLSLPDTLPGQRYNISACFSDTAVLIAAVGKQCYRWDSGSTDSFRLVYQPGVYYVSYFQDCAITTDTYNVRFIKLPEVPTLIYGCPGDIQISIVNPAGQSEILHYTLKNSNGDTVSSMEGNTGFFAGGLIPGTYTLNIASNSGCDTTLSLQLVGFPVPELLLQPTDTTIAYGQSLQLSASAAQFYVWFPPGLVDSPTKSNPLARPLKPTTFTVIGINEYGCRDTGYVNVDIDYRMPDMVPNAFSPNGDGINDIFRIEGITYQDAEEYNIFNRYGQRIYSSMEAKKGWDGSQNGKPCDAGTYFYLIKLRYPDGREKTYKGEVQLLR